MNDTKLKHILQTVCDYYQMNKSDVIQKNRKINNVIVRQVYIFLAKKLTNEKMENITELVNIDRSTGIYSAKLISNEIFVNPVRAKQINEIQIILEKNKYKDIVVSDVDLLKLSQNFTNSFIKL